MVEHIKYQADNWDDERAIKTYPSYKNSSVYVELLISAHQHCLCPYLFGVEGWVSAIISHYIFRQV